VGFPTVPSLVRSPRRPLPTPALGLSSNQQRPLRGRSSCHQSHGSGVFRARTKYFARRSFFSARNGALVELQTQSSGGCVVFEKRTAELPFNFSSVFLILRHCMPLCVLDFAVQVHVVPCLLDNYCYLVRLRLLFAIFFL